VATEELVVFPKQLRGTSKKTTLSPYFGVKVVFLLSTQVYWTVFLLH
jgi:hypothetical protein